MGNSGHACFKPDDLDELDTSEILGRTDRDALRWLEASNGAPASYTGSPQASGMPAAGNDG